MLSRAQSGPSSSKVIPSDPHAQDSTRRQPLQPVRTDTVIDLTEEEPPIPAPVKAPKSASFDDSPPRTDGRATNLRTYGGPSRSFLIAIPTNQIPSLTDSQLTEDSVASLLQSQEDEFGGHESYTSLRSRWGVDNSEDDPFQPLAGGPTTWLKKRKGKSGRPPQAPAPGSNNSELRSITELRNTGESRRFNDEVGYLFEGLTSESELSVKRSRCVYSSPMSEIPTEIFSAVELVGKLADPQFSRQARSADFVMHAWETLRAADGDSGDRILGTALDVFVLFVSRDARDFNELANRGNLVPVLFGRLATMARKSDPLCILNCAENDVELKQRGFGRTDKLPVRILLAALPKAHRTHGSAQLNDLNKVVVKSSIFPKGTLVGFFGFFPQLELKAYLRYPIDCLWHVLWPPFHLLSSILRAYPHYRSH